MSSTEALTFKSIIATSDPAIIYVSNRKRTPKTIICYYDKNTNLMLMFYFNLPNLIFRNSIEICFTCHAFFSIQRSINQGHFDLLNLLYSFQGFFLIQQPCFDRFNKHNLWADTRSSQPPRS